jgi:hypothetical protein
MTGWRKSSYSNPSGNCLEWRWAKSSHSGTGNCTEARLAGGAVLVRDSKDAAGPVLTFTPAAWAAFVAGVRAGRMPG